MERFLITIYLIGDFIAFMYFTFFTDYAYTWWNWIFVIPLNMILSVMWPISLPMYWISQ